MRGAKTALPILEIKVGCIEPAVSSIPLGWLASWLAGLKRTEIACVPESVRW